MKRLLLVLLLVTACSSGHPETAATYVSKVNALCDALLAKVGPYSHPGHYPIATYRAELAGHTALEKGFDSELAGLSVPAAARAEHTALKEYLALADGIDGRRAAAAAQGQAAFDKEIDRVLQGFATDPVHLRLIAAGFSESCTAR